MKGGMSSSMPPEFWPHFRLTLFHGDPDAATVRWASREQWAGTSTGLLRYSGLIDTDGTWFQYDAHRDAYVADDGTVFATERPPGGPQSGATGVDGHQDPALPG